MNYSDLATSRGADRITRAANHIDVISGDLDGFHIWVGGVTLRMNYGVQNCVT